jgi:hypothetical protein
MIAPAQEAMPLSPSHLEACVDAVAVWLEASHGFTPERAIEAALSQAHRIARGPNGLGCARSLVDGSLIPDAGMDRIADDYVVLERARAVVAVAEQDAAKMRERAESLERLENTEDTEPAGLTTEQLP